MSVSEKRESDKASNGADSEKRATLTYDCVCKAFVKGERRAVALSEINLTVQDEEFVSIVGPSGCGKSTLLNLTAGLIRPSHGQVRYRGQPVERINTEIGYVTQRDNLLPWRTLINNVELGMEVRGIPTKERRDLATEYVNKVGLGGFERHYPHELSGGMRQRANIIRTLAYGPKVVLMDEPFGPLDALTRSLLQEQLLRLWSEARKTIIFITHDLTEAIALSDRVIIMTARPGKIRKILPINIPRPRDLFHIHDFAGFREAYDEAWDLILSEMGRGQKQ